MQRYEKIDCRELFQETVCSFSMLYAVLCPFFQHVLLNFVRFSNMILLYFVRFSNTFCCILSVFPTRFAVFCPFFQYAHVQVVVSWSWLTPFDRYY